MTRASSSRCSRTRATRWLVLATAVCATATAAAAAAASSNSNSNNLHRSPFAVLGIANSQTATQEEIKQRYRRLCLEYHPDKNQHLPIKQREERERLFKELQTAYELIGTPQARVAYKAQSQAYNQFRGYQTASPFSSTQSSSAHRFSSRPSFGRTSSSPFIDIESLFRELHNRDNNSPLFGFPNTGASPTTRQSNHGPTTATAATQWKSIFVQHVTIPLQDLYTGRSDYEFTLRDNLWTRLVAAIRGKFAVALFGRSVLNALPILYFSYKMAICAALYFFFDRLPHLSHHHRPRMVGHLGRDHVTFTAHLQPGYKANTKLIFNDVQTGHAGVEVHFVLKEAKHAVYTRVGNNLHVACTITPKQAAMGCNVEIPSLSDPDFRLAVAIPRHVSTGDCVVVPDKGWPNRKRKGVKGDLIVTVHVASTLWRRPSRISTV